MAVDEPVGATRPAELVVDESALARQDHLVPAAPDRPTEEALVFSGSILVRRVEQVDAELEGPIDGGGGALGLGRPVRAGHAPAAKAERADGQAVGPEGPCRH